MTDYFAGFATVEDIKKEYRRLAFLHHPDVGGDTATMQAVNEQYHRALKGQHQTTSVGSDNEEHTYYYNEEHEQAIMDKVGELLALGIHGDCDIWIIGKWIWVEGETKPHRAELKAAGCRWHSKRLRWYWRLPTKRRTRYNEKVDFDGLMATYGATKMSGPANGHAVQ